MWMSYLAICLPRRIKKRPIDGRSVNKRMVGRNLEMSTRSGSKERAGCFAVVWLFLAVPWVYLRFVIVEFSDHTHYF